MGNKGCLNVRFSNNQKYPDEIAPSPYLRRLILELAEDNMDSISKTIYLICREYIKYEFGWPVDLRVKIISIGDKESFDKRAKNNNLSSTVCKICKHHFEKYPPRKKPELSCVNK